MGIAYQTSDLYYAAYLKVAEVPFLGTKREGNMMFFLFEPSDAMNDLKVSYFSRISKVSALTYADEIKSMKSLTHMSD